MESNMFDEILSVDLKPFVGLGDILKIPLILLLVGCLFYSFMLFLKVRILMDTVESTGSSKVKVLTYLNLSISLLVSIVGTIIIVLG